MPNWCYTSLTVTGDTQEVSRFVKGIKTRQEEIGADNPSILDTYFPTPQELHITEGFVGEEKQKELDVLYAANTEKFGHRSWYDWNCENWGSKWHDCNTYIQDDSEDLNEVVFSFETAWSPISQGIKHISSLFPTLGFVLSYNEEAGFYVGAEAYLAGEQLFFGQEEPDNPEQAENEDDDAYYTRIDEGRNDLQSQLEEGAENALFTALERLG
jgi:hypothetical protein